MRLAYSSGFVEGYSNTAHSAWLPPPPSPSPQPQQAPRAPQAVQAQLALEVPTTQLFEVNVSTQSGDIVVLVGSTDALGNWNPHKGVQMETSEAAYPIWHTWIRGCLPMCEFKFVICRGSGEVEWEQNDNRKLKPLTNRVGAIFGDAREITRTCEADAALFARRQEGLLLAAQLRAPAPASTHAPYAASSGSAQPPLSPYVPRAVPPVPTPHPVSLNAVPPPLALGSPFTPFVAYVAGNSVASSPCVSRADSRPSLSRQSSSASCSGLRRSVSAQSHNSLSGARVSFSRDLNDLTKNVIQGGRFS